MPEPDDADGIQAEAQPTHASSAAHPAPGQPGTTAGTIDLDRPCLACGYNLRGLSPSSVCPECGSSVARSLQGNLLRFSGAEYLRQLHRGVFLVQASIIIQILATIVVMIGGVALVWLGGSRPSPSDPVQVAAGMAKFGSSIITLAGWWLLSWPDPAILGTETGANARKVVRASVVVYTAAAGAGVLLDLAHVPRFNPRNAQLTLGLVMALVGLIASVVWFFAAMRYLRWLGPRIPNLRVQMRAKLLTWLGPVLYILGCGVGGLVALVMYYNLLNWVRKDLRAIRAQQESERLIPG
jgi:hypothetical protein